MQCFCRLPVLTAKGLGSGCLLYTESFGSLKLALGTTSDMLHELGSSAACLGICSALSSDRCACDWAAHAIPHADLRRPQRYDQVSRVSTIFGTGMYRGWAAVCVYCLQCEHDAHGTWAGLARGICWNDIRPEQMRLLSACAPAAHLCSTELLMQMDGCE